MQITFLVGNGFDVAFGLQTQYKDFYNWYIKQKSSKEHIKRFKEEIKQYILGSKKEENKENINWSDFEIGFGQYSRDFEEGEEEKYLECYDDVKERLMEYLEKEETKISDILDKVDCNIIWQGVRTFYQNLSEREKLELSSLLNDLGSQSHTVKFISFNYTNALDQLINKIKGEQGKVHYGALRRWTAPSNVYHIHGIKNKYPIIGLSDKSQIANVSFRENEEILDTLIKSKSIDVIRKNWYIDAKREITQSSIICIYGMSLGESDKLWWELILDWLSKSGKRQLFLYMYDKKEMSSISIREYRKYQNVVMEKIRKYACNGDISKISNQIHIIRNSTNLFYFEGSKK